ncbi:MAG: low-specificity L-threonine aldolase [Anaerolineales bacterium]|nr:low-specificity L-threonine aldolase [Anaerolineales bacterium]
MQKIIDLRSDTVTKPTPEMREAMATAEVGDDVYGDDPTINRLEGLSAERMGKEAALFIPSGTMGNLLAVITHCGRGDEVIVGNQSHTFHYEVGGISALGSVHSCQVTNQPDGTFDLDELRNAIRGQNIHLPITRLICVENTHNRCGGISIGPDHLKNIYTIAREHNLQVHMDGARLFNTAVDLGIPAKDLASHVDTVTFCLSKGLCAPVGSVLCGSKEFIHKARYLRKQLGGGMRQAGILAAAGIVALEKMVDRLAEDHKKVQYLAKGLQAIPSLTVDTAHTNMLYFSILQEHPYTGKDLVIMLKEKNILANDFGPKKIRMIPHYWSTDEDIEYTAECLEEIFNY